MTTGVDILEEFITNEKRLVQKHFYSNCWNKIVKRSIVNNMIIEDANVNVAEDLLYNTEILMRANLICLLPEAFYIYFVNNESVIQTSKGPMILENRILILKYLQFLSKKYEIQSILLNNVLLVLERETFNDLTNVYLAKNSQFYNAEELIKSFGLFDVMDARRLNSLKQAFFNRYFCFYLAIKYDGIKGFISRVIYSLFN